MIDTITLVRSSDEAPIFHVLQRRLKMFLCPSVFSLSKVDLSQTDPHIYRFRLELECPTVQAFFVVPIAISLNREDRKHAGHCESNDHRMVAVQSGQKETGDHSHRHARDVQIAFREEYANPLEIQDRNQSDEENNQP